MPALLLSQTPPQTAPRAPVVTGPKTKEATRPTASLPQHLIDEARLTERVDFDPSQHLNFEPPKNVLTMKEIGLAGHGIAPIAASDPFPLFTGEAIQQMRAEVLSDEVLRDCQYTSDFCKNMIRGMGPRRAPFTYAAWKSPELISKISQIAGIELVPSMDYEIAHINISVNKPAPAEQSAAEPVDDGMSAFSWHYDSFPFVCVVMLSDCTGMVGGETAIKTPGGVIKIRGPAMGTAVVMQGRYIEHQALKAVGGRERISMVTCFRAKSPHVRDETVLTGVRGISQKSEMYTQFTEYRLEMLEERIRAKAKAERRRETAGKPFDNAETVGWLVEQKEFLEAMIQELAEE